MPRRNGRNLNNDLLLNEICGISYSREKHLDTVRGGSYIYISLFEGEVRPGKARQRPMNYMA
jgi:hypothetical protein